MLSLKSIVQQSQQMVLASDLKNLLLPLWQLIEWQSHADAGIGDAELCRSGNAMIKLYPSLLGKPDATRKILREFGQFVLLRAEDRGTAIWKNKLDVPTEQQLATVKEKLADVELRKTCTAYGDVLDTYPSTGGSVDRLVFINIANALLANNIPFSASANLDILTWGPTTEYCQRKKYHCLVPLVSAYAPADVYSDYGYALAAQVSDKLAGVRDSSVAFALRGIVQRIAKIANPA